MVVKRMIINNIGRQRLMLNKSISDSFLLGSVLAPATSKEKEWSQQN